MIAKVSRAVNISPGQLNPPAWRILIAMQNLGDLEGLLVGVAEVLYCYSVSPLNGGERRYHLHPRSRMLPVQELSRSEKKHHPVCEGNWHQSLLLCLFQDFLQLGARLVSRAEYCISCRLL